MALVEFDWRLIAPALMVRPAVPVMRPSAPIVPNPEALPAVSMVQPGEVIATVGVKLSPPSVLPIVMAELQPPRLQTLTAAFELSLRRIVPPEMVSPPVEVTRPEEVTVAPDEFANAPVMPMVQPVVVIATSGWSPSPVSALPMVMRPL